MAKLTENAVMFANVNGTLVQVFLVKDVKDGKKVSVLKDATGTVHELKDCKHVNLLDGIENVVRYIDGHNALPCQPRSGYDNYYNGEGPTNPKSPQRLSVMGAARNALIFLQALHIKAAAGGQVGEDAQKALALIGEYNGIAAQNVAKTLADQKQAERAAKAAELGLTLAELDEMLAKRAAAQAATANVPTATVNEDEAEDGDDDAEDVLVSADGDTDDETADAEAEGAEA